VDLNGALGVFSEGRSLPIWLSAAQSKN